MLPFDIMLMKSGSTEGLVDLVDIADTDRKSSPGPATSGFTVSSNGTISIASPPPSGPVHTWKLQGSASDYDIKVVPIYGTFSTGNTGLWENLGTSRSWTISRTTFGESEVSAIVYIKLASGSVPIAQCTVTFISTIEF